MIVRILGEGQWVVNEELRAEMNLLDEQIAQAVADEDESKLSSTLTALLTKVREEAEEMPLDILAESDFILPDESCTLEQMRELLDESEEGLVPN